MNSIISLVVRSLYSLVAVFFFVFTVQPVVAATTHDADIEVLQKYVNGDRVDDSWETSHSLSNLPEGNADLASRILALKDADGNNLAHKFVETGNIELLTKLFKVCGGAIFEAKNKAGFNSFEANPGSLGPIFRQIDPDYYYGDSSQAIEVQKRLRPLALPVAPSLVAQYRKYKNELSVAESGREGLETALRDISDSSSSEVETLNAQLYKIWENSHPIRENLSRSAEGLGGFALSFGISALQRLIPLEQIDDFNFYQMLSYSEEGRKELRTYRTYNGKTLYSYFNENAKNDGYESGIKDVLLSLYYGAGISVPTATEVDITTISGSDWGFAKFLETPDGKNFFEKYKNSHGQNLAFIAANDVSLLEKMKDQGVDVMGMLQAKDIHGNDGISQIKNSWSSYRDIDPTLDALISERLEEKEQEKIRLEEAKHLKARNAFEVMPVNDDLWDATVSIFQIQNSRDFADISLDSVLKKGSTPLRDSFLQKNFAKTKEANQLWKSFFATYDELERQERVRYGYLDGSDVFDENMFARPIRVLNVFERFVGHMDQDSILPETIEIILTLQSNVLATGGTFGMNFERMANEDESNAMIRNLESLGRSLFNAKKSPLDDLFIPFNEGGDKVRGLESEIHSLMQSLKKKPENQNIIDQKRQEVAQLKRVIYGKLSSILKKQDSTFSAEITEDNEQEMIGKLVSPILVKIGREIADTLFVKYLGNMTVEQMFKLETHQTNCAVMALYSCLHGDFDTIDKILASRPLMRDKGASYYRSSKQRYEDVMQMAGHHHDSGDDDGMGGIPLHSGGSSRSSSVDFGEEY